MTFGFDTVHPRLGTDSQKWQKYGDRDVLPMWVADMDFRAPPAVLDALKLRVAHGIFGYSVPMPSTLVAVVDAMERRYGWRIDPAWIVWLPGLVCGLNVASRAYALPGEQVMSLTPVYPPFLTTPRHAGRESLAVPLALDAHAGRWEIDFDAMARAVGPRTRLLFLCNPHNPIGRVFDAQELRRLGEFCLRHRLVLCADEVHCDLILSPVRHTPVAMLGPELAAVTVTLMAPSKTYNLPGLGTAMAIISDADLRARFVQEAQDILAEVNCFGYTACEAAYREGDGWRDALLDYLRSNRDAVTAFVADELPGVAIEAPIDATYLAWLNVQALGLVDPVGHFELHGVGLSDGMHFGSPRGRHVRLNFGCPRATLRTALARMKRAVQATRPA